MAEILDEAITIIGTLFMVVAILFLSYVVSKRIGKGMVRFSSSAHMKIVDRIIVGQDRSLLIIKAGGKYCLIGVSPAGIEFLQELSEDDMSVTFSDDDNKPLDFREIISQKFTKK